MQEKIKNFINQNWMKIIISICLILVCVSIGYYFVFYLPKIKQEQIDLENQIKCQQLGNEQYKEDYEKIIAHEGKNILVLYSNPIFKFNKEMRTCLYKVEENSSIILLDTEFVNKDFIIKDIYTNQEIFIWSQHMEDGVWKNDNRRSGFITHTEEDWNNKLRELFRD